MTLDTYRCPEDRCGYEQLIATTAVATNIFTEQGVRHCHVICLCPDCGNRIYFRLDYKIVHAIERFLMALPPDVSYDDDVNWDQICVKFDQIVAKEFGW